MYSRAGSPFLYRIYQKVVKKMKSAYIHIPFCHHICHYCDFNKVFMKGQPVDEYLASLKNEMQMQIEKNQQINCRPFLSAAEPQQP